MDRDTAIPDSGGLTTPLRFPMPGLGPVDGRERPIVDGEHRLLEPWSPTLPTLMGPAVISAGSQRRVPVHQARGTQETRIWLVNSLIDAFVAQPHRRVVGETLAQMAADLLRAPPLAKQLGHHDAELLVGVQPPAVLTRSTCGSPTMSIEGPIPAPRDGIAPQLP